MGVKKKAAKAYLRTLSEEQELADAYLKTFPFYIGVSVIVFLIGFLPQFLGWVS